MKIGFLGNANNYPFMLARAMRTLGHDVKFIVTCKSQLDRPEYRYEDIKYPYPEWIYDLSQIRLKDAVFFRFFYRKKIEKVLRDCDVLIANQFGPMLLSELCLPTICLLTGDDLEYADFDKCDELVEKYTFPAIVNKLVKWYLATSLIKPQRAAIHSSIGVVYFPRGILPGSDRLLEEIGVLDQKRIFNLMTETEMLSYCPQPFNTPMRIFCGARLNWSSLKPEGGNDLNYKGAEIMIKGLAHFVASTGTNLNIRLVKKGLHVNETMELVENIGLSNQVTWLNEMNQKQVIDEYRQADIVFDQLGNGSIGMVSLDAMATGRPVIANGRPEIFEQILKTSSPICQARTPLEVSEQVKYLHKNPHERERIGIESRKYAEEYFSNVALAKRCIEILTVQNS